MEQVNELTLYQKIRQMGLLRNLMQLTALIMAAMMPFARGPEYSDSWNLFFGGILPATGPIVVIVIGLDIMMSTIWRADAEDPERVAHFSMIIRCHQIVGATLLIAWLTVFLPVLA